MSTILLTWELGSGLGHLLPLRTIGMALAQRGHHVCAALRDTSQASDFLAVTAITPLQAPAAVRPQHRPFPHIGGFAHMLANIGFADPTHLATQVAAWQRLIDDVKPDLVIADHSPTALLALRSAGIPTVNLGLAFYSPPDTFPLPLWTAQGHLAPHLQMAQDERPLLDAANAVLAQRSSPPMERLGQLFNQVAALVIATYKEFDPFGPRPGTRYWGHWHAQGGLAPAWPEGRGPKVFAYVKPFPALDHLLSALAKEGVPSLIVAGMAAATLREKHKASNLHFEKNPVNLPQAAAQCDLGITNAGHGTMASLLLAGKPLLLFPLYVEQLLNAQAVERLGAGGRIISPAAADVLGVLREMLSTDRYTRGAQAFAARYAGFPPGQQVPELVQFLERHIRT